MISPTAKHTITTVEQAFNYTRALNRFDLVYYYGEDPREALETHDLSPEELENIEYNVNQILKLDFADSEFDDVHDMLVIVINS